MYLKVGFVYGESINDAAQDMCALAKSSGFFVRSVFNGVELLVTPKSNSTEIIEKYMMLRRPTTYKDR